MTRLVPNLGNFCRSTKVEHCRGWDEVFDDYKSEYESDQQIKLTTRSLMVVFSLKLLMMWPSNVWPCSYVFGSFLSTLCLISVAGGSSFDNSESGFPDFGPVVLKCTLLCFCLVLDFLL